MPKDKKTYFDKLKTKTDKKLWGLFDVIKANTQASNHETFSKVYFVGHWYKGEFTHWSHDRSSHYVHCFCTTKHDEEDYFCGECFEMGKQLTASMDKKYMFCELRKHEDILIVDLMEIVSQYTCRL